MKTRLTTALPAVLLATLAAPVLAAEQAPGLYYNIEGGANFAQSIDLKAAGSSTSTGFDAGYRFGAVLGYHLDRQWSVQFDTGYLYNSVEGSSHGSLSHVPFLVSGRWHHSLWSKLDGALGLGLGGSLNQIEVGTGSTSDADGGVNVAWQASAALSYPLADNMSLGFFYNYLGTAGTDYRLSGINVDTSVSHNHSFGLSFHLDF
jgi:opacity protein-like surface antigen